MEPITTNQCWTYRAPSGFEHSRLVVGATVDIADNSHRIICASVIDAPRHRAAKAGDTLTIPFLPMTEAAFRVTTLALEGTATPPPAFGRTYPKWRHDPRGLAAFSVPFEGSIEQMIDLQRVKKKGSNASRKSEIATLLNVIREMLASGLETEVEPFPRTEKEFSEILGKLKQLDPGDLKGKLVIGGFKDRPHGPDGQRCLECIYYLPHRLWCDLPELAVPVEPYWWCRLWRL